MSAMAHPRTASPRNSSRSLLAAPGVSAHHERCASARCSSAGSEKRWPTRSARSSSAGSAEFARAEPIAGSVRRGAFVDVVDRVPDGLEVLEVLVLDAEADRAVAQLLLERFDEFDQRERVGVEVVDERLPLGDGRRLDLEDVGEPVTDDLEDLLTSERALFHMCLCWHGDRV